MPMASSTDPKCRFRKDFWFAPDADEVLIPENATGRVIGKSNDNKCMVELDVIYADLENIAFIKVPRDALAIEDSDPDYFQRSTVFQCTDQHPTVPEYPQYLMSGGRDGLPDDWKQTGSRQAGRPFPAGSSSTARSRSRPSLHVEKEISGIDSATKEAVDVAPYGHVKITLQLPSHFYDSKKISFGHSEDFDSTGSPAKQSDDVKPAKHDGQATVVKRRGPDTPLVPKSSQARHRKVQFSERDQLSTVVPSSSANVRATDSNEGSPVTPDVMEIKRARLVRVPAPRNNQADTMAESSSNAVAQPSGQKAFRRSIRHRLQTRFKRNPASEYSQDCTGVANTTGKASSSRLTSSIRVSGSGDSAQSISRYGSVRPDWRYFDGVKTWTHRAADGIPLEHLKKSPAELILQTGNAELDAVYTVKMRVVDDLNSRFSRLFVEFGPGPVDGVQSSQLMPQPRPSGPVQQRGRLSEDSFHLDAGDNNDQSTPAQYSDAEAAEACPDCPRHLKVAEACSSCPQHLKVSEACSSCPQHSKVAQACSSCPQHLKDDTASRLPHAVRRMSDKRLGKQPVRG